MKNNNIFSSFITKNIWIILSIIIIIIFFHFFTYKMLEGFDLSMSSSSLGATTKSIPEEYQYLAPLPEGYAWSTETQDKYIAYIKQKDPNSTLTKTDLASGMFKMASEEEVKIYLDTDLWPWDEYIINYLTTKDTPLTIDQINNWRKGAPNRLMYAIMVEKQTVPKLKIIDDIFMSNTFSQIKGLNDQSWYCELVSNGIQSQDHYNFMVKKGEELKSVTDYSLLTEIIPDFAFESNPCNICDIRNIRLDDGKSHQYQDIYDSEQNKCKFILTGEVPEAYNIYIGKYGNAQADSVPASTSEDAYKKCVSACDKYKI